MPQSISVLSAIEAHRLSSPVPYLALISIEIINPDTGSVVTVQRVARNPEPVIFRGNTFNPGAFDISLKSEAGKLAEVSLSVTDYTQVIEARLQANGGGIGSNVTFYVVAENNLAGDPDVEEHFQIIGVNSSNYRHEFTLGAENALNLSFPRRRQTKDFCQWRYKSAECGYTGPNSSCDLTLQGPNGCASHNNTINFGAFPGINSNGFRYI